MKTPEEIKKGLELCRREESDGISICDTCPYDDGGYDMCACTGRLSQDALSIIQQLEGERDEALELIGKLIVILKKYPNAATNGCAYDAYKEIKKYLLNLRGACK